MTYFSETFYSNKYEFNNVLCEVIYMSIWNTNSVKPHFQNHKETIQIKMLRILEIVHNITLGCYRLLKLGRIENSIWYKNIFQKF